MADSQHRSWREGLFGRPVRAAQQQGGGAWPARAAQSACRPCPPPRPLSTFFMRIKSAALWTLGMAVVLGLSIGVAYGAPAPRGAALPCRAGGGGGGRGRAAAADSCDSGAQGRGWEAKPAHRAAGTRCLRPSATPQPTPPPSPQASPGTWTTPRRSWCRACCRSTRLTGCPASTAPAASSRAWGCPATTRPTRCRATWCAGAGVGGGVGGALCVRQPPCNGSSACRRAAAAGRLAGRAPRPQRHRGAPPCRRRPPCPPPAV